VACGVERIGIELSFENDGGIPEIFGNAVPFGATWDAKVVVSTGIRNLSAKLSLKPAAGRLTWMFSLSFSIFHASSLRVDDLMSCLVSVVQVFHAF
jgi:hypothetical protein